MSPQRETRRTMAINPSSFNVLFLDPATTFSALRLITHIRIFLTPTEWEAWKLKRYKKSSRQTQRGLFSCFLPAKEWL